MTGTETSAEGLERAIADQIRAAYGGEPIAPFAGALGSSDVARAYRVQEINTRLWEAQGRRIVGRKIGLTAPAVRTQFGVDEPDFGILFDDMRKPDGAPIGDRLLQPRIEAEIAFVMRAGLEDVDLDAERFAAAVARLHPALEIVDSRVRDWRIGIVDTVADNASAAFFVLGEAGADPKAADAVGCAMRLTADGETVSQGRGADCMGSPFVAGAWLARKMVEVGRPLRAGEIVMSGALGPMAPVRPGATYRAVIEGIGEVSARF